jgi:hypothetical protein
MKTTLSVFILCFTLLAFRVHSQNTELDPGWQWGRLAHVFNSVWNGKMCTDFNNNIFQYCNYRYSITIEDTSFYHDGDNPNHRNIAVIKRNAVGDFVKAVDMYTADEGNVFRNFLAVDKESNVYVYGAFTDTLFVNDQLVLPKYISFQPDIFLVKLDNNLEFLWAKIFAALYQDDVRGLDVSADNFIYITLRDYGSGGNRLVKLDPEGQMQWELQFTAVQ